MKIGVFDSGIGGLTVVKSLLEHQLFEEIVYFGDTARVPYGIKDKNTIVRYAIEAVGFFKNFELDLIIVACNTVSAYALNEMKETSSCPIIGVVEAGVLATNNALKDKDSNILILGTKATINSKAYENALGSLGFKNLQAKATGLFVPLVEEEIYSGEILEATFKYYFNQTTKPDAIILGCTHFPLISNSLKKYFHKNTILIHSGDAIVEYLENNFDFDTKYQQAKLKFFASENPDALKNIASKWLNKSLYV
ncbi:MAG: glutamate racemase [Sulfurimonas sp.]|nr:glutamate racemase [Campylobacteraceae bacterium]MCF6341002.1 glutamate racemase [Sulfurimonas sp.]